MKGAFALSVILTSFLLYGCASKAYEPLKTEQKDTFVTSENGSTITVKDMMILEDGWDNQLRLITRQDTANLAAAKTIQAISGVLLRFGGSINGFDKNDLKGSLIFTQPNPVKYYLTPKIIEVIKIEMERRPKQSYQYTVNVIPDEWRLVYKNLAGGDDNYQLTLNISFTYVAKDRRQEFTCSSEKFNPKEYTLPDWQANNYEKVTEVSHQIMDRCAQEFAKNTSAFIF